MTQEKQIWNNENTLYKEQFRKEIELITDKLKLVFGSSNDGNTIRKFFKFTEIDRILIKKFINFIIWPQN